MTRIGAIELREVKHTSFRFYCICTGTKVQTVTEEEFISDVVAFIEASKKNNEQQGIARIISDLKKYGFDHWT